MEDLRHTQAPENIFQSQMHGFTRQRQKHSYKTRKQHPLPKKAMTATTTTTTRVTVTININNQGGYLRKNNLLLLLLLPTHLSITLSFFLWSSTTIENNIHIHSNTHPVIHLERRDGDSNDLRVAVRDANGSLLNTGLGSSGFGVAVEL
jgi:hypothetical protein